MLGVANGHEGPPGGCTQQIQHGQGAQDAKRQAQVVERHVAVELESEHLGGLDGDTGIAAGHAFPAGKALFNDEAKGQRCDAQVDAFDPQRGHAHDDARHRREHHADHQRHRKRKAQVGEVGLGIGPHAHEGGLTDRDLAGVARQQHQAQAHDGVDQHETELRQPVLLKQHGRNQQHRHQCAVPESMTLMLGERDILLVAGLEDETHGNQTFLRSFSPNKPFGLNHSISNTTM